MHDISSAKVFRLESTMTLPGTDPAARGHRLS
jgi:hypothetical protein